MSIPPFAPFPSTKVRHNILPHEWELYINSWTSLAALYLRLNDESFNRALIKPETLTDFLRSIFSELARDATLGPTVVPLRNKCFLLLHRIWSGYEVPSILLSWQVLSNVCSVFPKSEQLRTLLHSLWKRKGTLVEQNLRVAKSSLIKFLESKNLEDGEEMLERLGPLLWCSPDAAEFMFTGSDFLDTINFAYLKVQGDTQKKLVAIVYLGLMTFLEGPKPNYSLLSDHLFTLKNSADRPQNANPPAPSLLSDLATKTPLLDRIRTDTAKSGGTRLQSIAASLSHFQQPDFTQPKKTLMRRKLEKTKARATDDGYTHGTSEDIHFHRMNLVSQIQDLFPDLGPGFIVRLLDEYNNNLEEITAHLLEDTIAPHLVDADRSEGLPSTGPTSQPHYTPRSTPPPTSQRRNVFDNDDFDRLIVETSRLQIGRKGKQLTADHMLSDRSNAPAKSAIFSALAAFDSDDDERDNTYDLEDVGGTIDSAVPGADEADLVLRDKNEEVLFRAYSSSPGFFGRDAETRRSKTRADLKSETGMTNEAIEGWGIMIGRDPKRLRRLEERLLTFSGQQKELASTAYRDGPAESGDGLGGGGRRDERGRGVPGRGRGRGKGRGDGVGAVASDDKAAQVARQRKETNKGSRANHNRRDQRARKMAKGGFSG